MTILRAGRPRGCGSIHGRRKRLHLHHSAWTDAGVHQVSYSLCTGYSSIGIKAVGASSNTMNTWTYKSTSTHTFKACKGTTLLFRCVRVIRKATISVIISACPSVSPHGTTRLPLDGFSWKFIFEYFSKIYRKNSSFIQIRQKKTTGSLHEE